MNGMDLKHAVTQIEIPEDMNARIISRVSTGTRSQPKLGRRRGAMVLLAAAICAMLSVPVLAATTDQVYQLLYRFAPAAAQFFKPVCRSDQDWGIRMDVLSAQIEGNTAKIYLSFCDLAGDRVDGTIDLNDSYAIHRPFDSSAHCELVGFDDETKTALFLVTITEYGNRNIEGDKITFSVREFLSRKEEHNGAEVPVDWKRVPAAAERWEDVVLTGSGGLKQPSEEEALMRPSKNPLAGLSVKGIDLTGISYMDGKLHIQTAVRDRLKNDNHGYFYLVDETGTEFHSDYCLYAMDTSSGVRVDYCEQIFDVPREKAERCRLLGDFVTAGQYTSGSWQVTFPLESAEP